MQTERFDDSRRHSVEVHPLSIAFQLSAGFFFSNSIMSCKRPLQECIILTFRLPTLFWSFISKVSLFFFLCFLFTFPCLSTLSFRFFLVFFSIVQSVTPGDASGPPPIIVIAFSPRSKTLSLRLHKDARLTRCAPVFSCLESECLLPRLLIFKLG